MAKKETSKQGLTDEQFEAWELSEVSLEMFCKDNDIKLKGGK